ncbi:hypothetical protein FHX42_005335 [Saccharopolyspora lacisalsi]|uniref:Uncharacterized protein n=1 Tax=Halosaccharopolyspora lacisalsi TaxID=1000566 RepID=A0A839EAQ8_9PSEU|nr:hypothetical protein [Halosaccharopolyspora lacisalsi]MBA8827928.1 hypothetical protein [Halosaccharopolyspora lacisalsi]
MLSALVTHTIALTVEIAILAVIARDIRSAEQAANRAESAERRVCAYARGESSRTEHGS